VYNVAHVDRLAVFIFHGYPLIIIARGFMGAVPNIVISALALGDDDSAAVFVYYVAAVFVE
jgi:hypothetical protein